MRKQNKTQARILLVIASLLFAISFIWAADVYRPYLHNPSVAGGFDVSTGKFGTSLWTGAASYTYPIGVPFGTNGVGPVVFLSYNSHSTDSRPGIVGSAWSLSESYVYRDVNGSFSDTSNDEFKLVLNGQSYDLVYDSSDKRYYTREESYLYVINKSSVNNTKGVYWEVLGRDGTSYRFGYDNESELVSNLHDYVVKWSLDLITDSYSNNVYYSYQEDPFTDDIGVVYPNKIEYNNDRSRVVEFVYEVSNRPDIRVSYEQGNKIKESRRLREIYVKADGSLVRRYVFNYTNVSVGKSFISSISLYGDDNVTSLPSDNFEYSLPLSGWYIDKNFSLPSNDLLFENNGNEGGVRLVDLNRDGLMDIVRVDGSDPTKNQSWINNGSGWGQDNSWNIPDYIVNSIYNDTGLRFIDFNGDGLTDIVKGDNNVRKSWQNNGSGWLDNSTWYLPVEAYLINSSTGYFERGVRFTDFNSDGLVDILSSSEDWNYAWVNNGSGWVEDSNWEVPLEARFIINETENEEGVRLVDVNGDGLVDLVKAKGDNKTTWLNNGSGWVEDSSWIIPSGLYFIAESFDSDQGVRLFDVNGDGMIDLSRAKIGDSAETWLNNGSGWVRDDSWNVPGDVYFVSSAGTNKGVRIVDVNGDGIADLMDGDNNSLTFTNRASRAYLLKEVQNSMGGTVSINYTSTKEINNSGKDDISNLGFNQWLVGEIIEWDGLEGHKKISTYYSYQGGYFDYDKDEFRGFSKVDEIRPNISITTHWFYQNDSLKGKEYKTELFDADSKLFSRVEYNWNVSSQNSYYIIKLLKETNSLYGGSYKTPKVTKTEYSYDNYGNVLLINYSGDNSTSGDEKYEYLDYVYNTNLWIVDKVKNYSLFDSDGSSVVRESRYSYDSLNYGDTPTNGGLTNREDWLDNGDDPITTYSYNSYGNLVNETDAKGRVTKYVFGIRDSTYTFVDRTISAKGHIYNYDYDLGTGNLNWEVDSNGYTINYTYDVFGRIEKEILPYDSETYPTREYNYSFNGTAPESVKVSQREDSGLGTIDNYYFYDGLGNLIQIKKEAENSKQIVNDFYYDVIKRVINQSNPYFADTSENYSNPDSSVSSMDYFYDALSRIVQIKNPDGTLRNTTFDHWKTISYDENNNKKIYYLDAYGRIIKIIEYIGNNYFITTYDYDASNSLVSITDSQNNVFNYSYDSLGRKINEKNIDTGTWRYYYDEIGNLIKQTDNRSTNITLTYDDLNRLIAKNNSRENINYTYDDVNGTLWEIITSSLTTNFTYDNRLRVTKETRVIDNRIFTKQWTYDSLDRIKTETLPDGSVINYVYTVQGQIGEITNILDDVQYNALNIPTKLSYNNNLETNYTYDTNNYRIEKIKTGTDEQELNYKYDSVGNVVSINDTSNNFIITMIYDTIDRLMYSKKQNNSESGPNYFEFNYSYDSLGNILKKIENGDNMSYFHNLEPKHTPFLITMTDTVAPNITSLIDFNETFDVDGDIGQGDNISFNVTVTDDVAVESVWLKIWSGVAEISSVIWQGFLGLVTGNLFSVEVETNESFSLGENNYTVYANDTSGNEVSQNGSFDVVDNTFPSVTSLIETPSDPVVYSSGASYEFNATIIDTNLQTVLFEFDGVNYTASAIGDVYNVSLVDLGVGSYNYRWYADDAGGNVNNSENGSYTVDQATGQTSLIFDKASPQTYGVSINVSCSVISGEGGVVLFRDGVDVSSENGLDVVLGAGIYSYECNLSETQNYTSATNQSSFTIDKAVPSASLTNDTALSKVYDGVITNIGISESNTGDGDVSYVLWKDGVNVGSSNSEGSAGTYSYKVNTTGGENYSAVSDLDSESLVISQATSLVYTYINHSQSNLTMGNHISVWLNGTRETGEGDIKLYLDSVLINSGGSPLVNYSLFDDVGLYNITTIYESTQNYSGSYETWWLNVSDTTLPNVSVNTPLNQSYSVSLITFNVTGLDDVGMSGCWYSLNNGVDNVSLSQSGSDYVDVNSTMSEGSHEVKFWCNDTSDNVNGSESVSFIVDTVAPNLLEILDFNETFVIDGDVGQGDNVSFNVTITDDSTEVESVWLKIWQGAIGISAVIWQGFLSLISGDLWAVDVGTNGSFSLGENNYTVYANDTLGNEGSWNGSFNVVDNTLPGVNIVYPLNISYSVNVSDLNYSYFDFNSGSCWYSLDGGVSNSSPVSAGVNWTGLVSVEGSNTWTVYCNDTSGNENSSTVSFIKYTVSECRTISTANVKYGLVGDIINNTLTGDCIVISAENITLDCQGYYISSTLPYTGIYSDKGNTTVMNCNVSMGTSTGGRGIELVGASDSTIVNNNLWGSYYGLILDGVNDSVIEGNVFNENYDGVFLGSSFDNILRNNSADNNSNSGFVFYNSDGNEFVNASVINSSGPGVSFSGSDDNRVENVVLDDNYWGVYLTDSANNLIRDGLSSNTNPDVNLKTNSVNNTFLNFSYTYEWVDSSELIRKWYYRAYVNDSSGSDVSGVNVTGFNVSKGYGFNLTTDGSGWSGVGVVIDYVNLNGVKSYYSKYAIYADNVSLSDSHGFNASLGNDLNDVFTLGRVPDDADKYYVKNNSGSNVAWFGIDGNIVLKGGCFVGVCTAPANSFIVKNGTDTVAYINSSGDLCIETGDCSDYSGSCSVSDAFKIKGSGVVSYIDSSGDLCLVEGLFEGVSL